MMLGIKPLRSIALKVKGGNVYNIDPEEIVAILPYGFGCKVIMHETYGGLQKGKQLIKICKTRPKVLKARIAHFNECVEYKEDAFVSKLHIECFGFGFIKYRYGFAMLDEKFDDCLKQLKDIDLITKEE